PEQQHKFGQPAAAPTVGAVRERIRHRPSRWAVDRRADVVAYGALQRWVGRSIAVRPDVGVSYGLAAVAGVLVVRVADTWWRRYVIASLIVIAGEVPHLVELHRTRAPHCLADRPGGRGPPSARPWVPGMRFRAEKAPVAMALTRRTSRGPYGDLPEAKGPSQMTASQFPVFVDIRGIRCS